MELHKRSTRDTALLLLLVCCWTATTADTELQDELADQLATPATSAEVVAEAISSLALSQHDSGTFLEETEEPQYEDSHLDAADEEAAAVLHDSDDAANDNEEHRVTEDEEEAANQGLLEDESVLEGATEDDENKVVLEEEEAEEDNDDEALHKDEEANEGDEDDTLFEEEETEKDNDDEALHGDEEAEEEDEEALFEKEEGSTEVKNLDEGDELVLLQMAKLEEHDVTKALNAESEKETESKHMGKNHELQPPGHGHGGKTVAEPHVRLFYHIFVGGNQMLATSIVNEQMSNLQGKTLNSFEVDITTVGMPWDMASFNACGLNCSTCYHRAHYNEGWEPVTLQSLYEYCIQHPTKQVAYIHDKGSFHTSSENDSLRRFLMKGIVSQECVNMPGTCDVCSSRFSPMPHPHTSGNMWHAKCSHIRRLLPPKGFELTMDSFFQEQESEAPWSAPSFDGVGRYAAEHWVHSHPDTTPCDLHAGNFIAAYNLDAAARTGTWLPQLQTGIRWPLWRYSHPTWTLTPDIMAMWMHWRCLEWLTLYKKLPTDLRKWRFEEALSDFSIQKQPYLSNLLLGCVL